MNRRQPRSWFSLLLFLVMILSLLPAVSVQASQSALDKIEPLVLDEINQAGQADFFVWLTTQADLSAADQLKAKVEKGTYVYETLVATADRTQRGLRSYLDGQSVQYDTYYIVNAILVRGGNQALLLDLANRSDVAEVTANHTYQLQEPVIKEPASAQPNAIEPNLTFIHVPDVWAMGYTGQGMVVADDDTGLDETHPTVARHYRGCLNPPTCSSWDHNYNWWDATGTYPNDPYDGHGHGTHCTGIMIGDDGGSNQIGVAPGAQTIHCKNMSDGGSGTDAQFIECFEWNLAPWDLAHANPRPDLAPDAVNNSWGKGGGNQNQFRTAVLNLQAAGIVVEVSAGNEGSACATLRSPGDYNEVLTTGSVQHLSPWPGTITGFSSRGPSDLDPTPPNYFPDIMAPGESIRSSLPGNTYGSWSGTSMAGPHTTALVALMWSACPVLQGDVATTYQIIKDTAARLTGQSGSNCGGDYNVGPNNDWGYGTIDALAAVNAALAQCTGLGYLDGHVYDAVTNDPIDGATVTGVRAGGGSWSETTDSTGYYTMTVPQGDFDVTAAHPLYTPDTQATVVITGQLSTVDFSLQPRGHLYGYVTDYDNGFPLDAVVMADDGTTVNTDPGTGYYEMYLDAGTYVVTATVQDYAPGVATVVIDAGQDAQQDFGLQAAIVFIPAPLHVYVPWQTTYSLAATLTNRLPDAYDYQFTERGGGFIPGLLWGPETALPERADADTAPFVRRLLSPMAVGDPLFQIDTQTPTADNQNLGVEWAGGYWWITGGNNGVDPNKLYKLSEAGALVATYDQPAACTSWGGRDLAYDGQYLYTGCDNVLIYQFDPAAGAWTGVTIPGQISPPRALTYDPATDHFWTGNWNSNIIEFDRSGAVVHSYPNSLAGKYGMAWDSWSPTGPYLWVWSQDPGVVATQYYFDGVNLTPTGVTFTGINPAGDIAGGATIAAGLSGYPGEAILVGLHQGATVDIIVGYDIDVIALPPDVPWFGQEPTAGSVPAQSSINATMLFSATLSEGIDQPGDYWCDLLVQGDPQLTVRVTMTVEPGVDMGQVEGYVLDNCTGEPVEATVSIVNGDPITETTSDPDTGYYSAWLVEGSYDVVVSAPGYLDYPATLTIVAGQTVVLDANLVPDRPCAAIDPSFFDLWLLTGTAVFTDPGGMDVINGGGQPLDWGIAEKDGGYSPPLAVEAAPVLAEPLIPAVGTTGPIVGWSPADTPPPGWFDSAAPLGWSPESWGMGTPIPSGNQFGGMISTIDNVNYYLMGGLSSGGSYLNQNLLYDTAAGTWTPMAPMLLGRNNTHSYYNSDDGKIYVPGGYTGSYRSEFDVYDPANNSWTSLAPLPVAQAGINGGLVDGKLYVCGGTSGTRDQTMIYDIATNSWSYGATMPVPHYYGANVTYEGQIYIIGGYGETTFLRYDPATNTWQAGPALPAARNSPSAAVTTDGRIYVWGGGNLWTPMNTGAYYDIASFPGGSWTTITTDPLPQNNVRAGYACASSLLWSAGGGPQASSNAFNQYWDGSIGCYWPAGRPDVPWVWEVPVTGTVPGVSTLNVDIAVTALYTDATPMPLGAYTATLTLNSNAPGTKPAATVVLHIFDQPVGPVAGFESNSPVCLGEETVFVNTTAPGVPPATTYLWDFGDGYTSTLEAPTHVYAAAGTYDVSLEACNEYLCDSYSASVEVLWLPLARFTYSVVDLTVTFTNTSVGTVGYLWSFGDGITSTVVNPVHTYAVGGDYTVTLIATGSCGSDVYSEMLTISIPPVAGFESNSPVCLDVAMVFTNTTGGTEPLTYLWAFGDGATSTEVNPTHQYTAAGTYPVLLTATNSYGTDTAMAPVEVLPLPEAGFSYVSGGLVVTFTNGSQNAGTYLWAFDDGTTSTETNPIHTYPAVGTYTVTLTAYGDCGENVYQAVLVVSLVPVAGFTSNSPVCLGEETAFVNTSAGVPPLSFRWDFGDGAFSTERDPLHTYTSAGSYTVVLTATNASGSDTTSAVVEVDPLPVAAFSVDADGLTITFTNGSQNADTYLWTFDDGTTSTEANPVHVYPAEGTYTVTLEAVGPCGSDEALQVLQVTLCDQVKIVTVTQAISGCVATLTPVVAGDAPYEYLWDLGAFGTSTATNPLVDFEATGTYPVTLEVSNCSDVGHATMSFEVSVECAAMYTVYLPLQFKGYQP